MGNDPHGVSLLDVDGDGDLDVVLADAGSSDLALRKTAVIPGHQIVGRIDPFDMFGVPDFVPRPGRWKLRPMLRVFESAIDAIISTRRERIASDPDNTPRDILTFLLEATDPETGAPLSESEIRANILTFIAAGHETTANCITWALFLLSQSSQWRERVQAEADMEHQFKAGHLRF
jgi:cytochrome P450